jgi:hypothetical protein
LHRRSAPWLASIVAAADLPSFGTADLNWRLCWIVTRATLVLSLLPGRMLLRRCLVGPQALPLVTAMPVTILILPRRALTMLILPRRARSSHHAHPAIECSASAHHAQRGGRASSPRCPTRSPRQQRPSSDRGQGHHSPANMLRRSRRAGRRAGGHSALARTGCILRGRRLMALPGAGSTQRPIRAPPLQWCAPASYEQCACVVRTGRTCCTTPPLVVTTRPSSAARHEAVRAWRKWGGPQRPRRCTAGPHAPQLTARTHRSCCARALIDECAHR